MLHKTRGIVCKTLKYSDTSIITHIYTEKLGLQSYIVRGVRSAKSKGKAALYQHGNLLDLVVYHKESASLQNVSEANLAHMYTSTPFDVVKSALLIFYLEVLNKVLQEQEENEGLFDFLLNNSFIWMKWKRWHPITISGSCWRCRNISVFILQVAKVFSSICRVVCSHILFRVTEPIFQAASHLS